MHSNDCKHMATRAEPRWLINLLQHVLACVWTHREASEQQSTCSQQRWELGACFASSHRVMMCPSWALAWAWASCASRAASHACLNPQRHLKSIAAHSWTIYTRPSAAAVSNSTMRQMVTCCKWFVSCSSACYSQGPHHCTQGKSRSCTCNTAQHTSSKDRCSQ